LNLFLLALPFAGIAQAETPTSENDSVLVLSAVIIKGYESGRSLAETPVAVGFITAKDMERYANTSLLPSVNTIPGVRMEERSPGSYRLNIRGSLLRSPFGVRNLKVYWNDMPFTDAGGNTYLNLVDPSTIGSIEVLKGPGGSLYGANTGGIVVLHTDDTPVLNSQAKDHRFRVQLNGGSYNSFGEQAQWKYRDAKISSSFTQSHQQADGYRDNSRLRKDVLQWNGNTHVFEKDKMEWVLLYSDIYYQTPGGLNLTQMQQNPRQARQIAIDQKAAIYNKTLFAGTSYTHEFNKQWSNVTSLAFSHTNFTNPFITNYEKRNEDNLAVRSKFVYTASFGEQDISLIGGAEWLYGDADIDNYGNKKGTADTVQFKDRLSLRQWFPFVQLEWQLKKKLVVQAGISTNSNLYHYKRLTDIDNSTKKINFDEQFLPRLAILYPFNKNLSLYTSASKGFSPPNREEIRPSGGTINSTLQPEFGWNYEFGIRGNSANNRFEFDIAAYYFKLQNAIVRRMDSTLADYYVNAGGTDQKGLELRVGYSLINDPAGFFKLIKIWSGFTLNDYIFTEYIIGTDDHSGKALTGVPRSISVTGLDIATSPGMYLHASFNHTSKLPLNDANSEFASAYDLLQAKTGWKGKLTPHMSLELFIGIDNALDEKYSLGNDINAFGRRYYNPSPLRNYFGGIVIGF
ncbi:MAG: TonB-dependent receptor, partial [Chitinophagales bacterium]